MDENEMNSMEEDIIDFEDEDGNVIPFAVIDYVFYNGDEYALLTEVTDEALRSAANSIRSGSPV